MNEWAEVEFKVIVTRLPNKAFHLSVRDQRNEDFATVTAGDLDTALRMAVPYMAAVTEPDPFEKLLRARDVEEAESSSVAPDSPMGI